MKVYLYILVIIALAGIEGRPLVRDKKWAELAVFSFLLIAGTAVIVMNTVMFEPYRISTIIDIVFRPYAGAVKKLLTGF